MSQHIRKGKYGENIACKYLISQHYQILEKNWQYRKAELDIIAMDGNVLVIVEVKTRTTEYFGAPETAVTTKKMRLLTDAASAYMHEIDHQWEIRFDIISVVLEKEDKITHFKDAFFLRD